MGFWLIIYSEVITKKIRSLQLIFAPSLPFQLLLRAPSRELQEGATFLGNGIWALYTFRSYHKENSQVYNQYLLCRFHFNHCSLYIYIELPLRSSRMELHFWVMEFGLLIQSGAITKNFRRVGSILAPLFIFQFWYLSYIVDRHLLPVSKYTRAIIEHYYKGKVLQCEG